MFKIKRPAIIGLLIVLLGFSGYINHQLTQQAIRKTSKQYQQHEELEKEKYLKDINLGKSDKDSNEIEIELEDDKVNDEEKDKDKENIEEILGSNNKKTEEIISQEVSGKNINYFSEYRLSRDKLRASSVDRLNQIIDNSNSNEKMITEAQENIINIGKTSEKELQVEGLIKSKGFNDALVFLTENEVKVIISANELKEQDMVKILDILKSETEYDMNNIKIMKKE